MDNPIYSIHQALHHRSVFFIIHVESRVVECVSKDGMSIPGGDGIRRDVSGMGRHASAAGPNGGRPGQKKIGQIWQPEAIEYRRSGAPHPVKPRRMNTTSTARGEDPKQVRWRPSPFPRPRPRCPPPRHGRTSHAHDSSSKELSS
jgi:hypothetical protein